MKSRKQQTALVFAGVAAGAAAAWIGHRQLSLVASNKAPRIEPPPIEPFLVDPAALDVEPAPDTVPGEAKEVWGVEPELSELEEELEGYDAVAPEDLGSVWLTRATQTSAEPHTQLINQISAPEPEDGSILEDATLSKVAKAERRKNAPG